MSITVAQYLRMKLENMKTWLAAEGCKVPLTLLQDVQIVALAQILFDDYSDAIARRDFTALLADEQNLPMVVLKAVLFVEQHEPLHDKFWRYLELFSKTVSGAQ